MTAVRLSWWAKNLDERKIALNELRFSRVGRRARLKGEVVTLAPLAGMLPPPPSQDVTVHPIPRRDRSHPKKLLPEGQSGLTETQMARFRRDFAGLDIPWLEREFRGWVAEKEAPDDYAAAFYGFMKRKQSDEG